MSTIAAAMFDFSGTLFRFSEQPEWFVDLRDGDGNEIHGEMQAELIRRMTAPTGMPMDLGPKLTHAWDNRDLDPALHRLAYREILSASGLPTPGHAESLYERVLAPESWQPYPDTIDVLRRLAERGVPIAVVSNIAFDLRKVLALHGIDNTISSWTLSYEVGAIKPSRQIFEHALNELGVAAEQAVMVGDSEEADGGARELGCAFEYVTPAPVADRPDALATAVSRHGLM